MDILPIETFQAPPPAQTVGNQRPWRCYVLAPIAAGLALTACSTGNHDNSPTSTAPVAPISTDIFPPTPSFAPTSEIPGSTPAPSTSQETSTSSSSPTSTEVTRPNNTSTATKPAPTTSHSPVTIGGCEQPGVPVSNGRFLNENNADDVQHSLDSLTVALNPNTQVGFLDYIQDTLHATAAITGSIFDPAEARALTYAKTHSGVTAEQLIAMKTFTQGNATCLTEKQIKEVGNIAETYVVGLGKNGIRGTSRAADDAWKTLAGYYNDFAVNHGLKTIPVN